MRVILLLAATAALDDCILFDPVITGILTESGPSGTDGPPGTTGPTAPNPTSDGDSTDPGPLTTGDTTAADATTGAVEICDLRKVGRGGPLCGADWDGDRILLAGAASGPVAFDQSEQTPEASAMFVARLGDTSSNVTVHPASGCSDAAFRDGAAYLVSGEAPTLHVNTPDLAWEERDLDQDVTPYAVAVDADNVAVTGICGLTSPAPILYVTGPRSDPMAKPTIRCFAETGTGRALHLDSAAWIAGDHLNFTEAIIGEVAGSELEIRAASTAASSFDAVAASDSTLYAAGVDPSGSLHLTAASFDGSPAPTTAIVELDGLLAQGVWSLTHHAGALYFTAVESTPDPTLLPIVGRVSAADFGDLQLADRGGPSWRFSSPTFVRATDCGLLFAGTTTVAGDGDFTLAGQTIITADDAADGLKTFAAFLPYF